jgi:hypothetical protein
MERNEAAQGNTGTSTSTSSTKHRSAVGSGLRSSAERVRFGFGPFKRVNLCRI